MSRPKARIVDHTIYGVYVWQLPSGEYLNDGENRQLSIAAVRGDIVKMNTLRKTAAALGYPDGAPAFLAGHRKITDEEYDDQMERHLDGRIADPYDFGAMMGELRANEQG